MSEYRGLENNYIWMMNDDGIIFSTVPDPCKWSVFDNPYSWSIKYFDDWRCIVDFLRVRQQ